MTPELNELLFTIRQHPAFHALLDQVGVPDARAFKPSEDADAQFADFIYRSGRRAQHECWRQFLIGEPSQQEQS